MHALFVAIILLSLLAGGCPAQALEFVYPAAAKGTVSDRYHGATVADPYRWLEDPDSKESRVWIDDENKLTQSVLEKLPSRQWFRDKLKELWDYDKYGVPTHRGANFFFTKQTGLQNQPVLYATKSARMEGPVVLVDPNSLSKDGTTSLAGYSPSFDGNLMAYGLSGAGSDWAEWSIKDVGSGADRQDKLKWIKFAQPVFAIDGKGLYYSRYPEPTSELRDANYFNKLYYHKLGTPQSEDKLLAENAKEKTWMYSPEVTEDGRYLIVSVSRNTNPENLVYVQDLKAGKVLKPLIENWGAEYSFVDNHGSVFYFFTNLDAPRGKLIAIDVDKPDKANWKEIIPQTQDTLRYAMRAGEKLVAHYIKDAHAELRLFDPAGKASGAISLPGMGNIIAVSGRRADQKMYYSYSGFTQPRSIYEYDTGSDKNELVVQPKVAFDPQDFDTRQVFVESTGGAKVPLFLVWNKKLVDPDKGPNRVHLYAYGGFNIAMLPTFSPAIVAWTQRGGVYAHACLRGGGEYGEDWHQAGMKDKKQNVFDDFINCARWLQANKFTTPAMQSISGGSNGGLLVGACLTQHPEIYGACTPEVGVLDMLRFHKFTIGHAWAGEYGSSDDAAAFKYLIKYSPLHNIQSGKRYPAVMIMTGDHDDRVVPAHSFKFAATLQAAQAKDGPPVLIRIETQAGHGAGKPTTKIVNESADKWTFLWDETGTSTQSIEQSAQH